MPPMQTRSQVGSGVDKRVKRKARPVRETSDSWELLDRQGLDSHNDDGATEDDDEPQESIETESEVKLEELNKEIEELATRVGNQVEAFAMTLDQFLEDWPTEPNRYDSAYDLILKFKAVAEERVAELKKQHEREMREQLKKEWSEQARISAASTSLNPFTSIGSASLSDKKAKQVKDLRQWQQEADIWELFRIMLELHPFEDDAQAIRADRERQLAKLGPPHRYSSEGDLWERFTLENDLARERSAIKAWFEQTADHQATDLQGIVEELEAKAGRGKGLWSSGWLATREKIKGEKRLRSWPNAEDSPLPQIRRSDNELLVTTLDPDAPLRQGRTLEKADSFFDRAIWVACWEMLRRGMSFQDICEWCEQRKEGWRAICMGKALDGFEPETSNARWRHMCESISQHGCSSDYEAAVFGLLGGNLKAVERICTNIDDHLFAYYSTILLQQFEDYLQGACPSKAMPKAWRRGTAEGAVRDPEKAQQAINDLIVQLRRNPSTSSEAIQPMKMIQSYLLADEVGSLIHSVGVGIAQTDQMRNSEQGLFFRHPDLSANQKPQPEVEVALDDMTLRIVTHMSVIHRALSPGHLEGDELREDENVLVAYIQFLRYLEKRSMIPTYAAQLSKERYVVVLARVLQDITNHKDSVEMIALLQGKQLDVVAILREQLNWAMAKRFDDRGDSDESFSILEPTPVTRLHPGLKISSNFIPEEIFVLDEELVRSLEWFKFFHGGWDVTFKALTLALRRSLVAGRMSTARAIVATFPYEDVSISKSYEMLHRAINVMNDDNLRAFDETESMTVALMRRQSRTYYELAQLVRVLESLARWSLEANQIEANRPPLSQRATSKLKPLKEDITTCIQPLLNGVLLNPVDGDEAEDLTAIRNTLLPEIIIAYAVMLYSAGSLISRDCLLESMDLSTVIANEKGGNDGKQPNGLVECFVKAGRMRELVNIFALTSKTMLVTKAEGRPWKPKKDRVGRELGLWELNAGARAGA